MSLKLFQLGEFGFIDRVKKIVGDDNISRFPSPKGTHPLRGKKQRAFGAGVFKGIGDDAAVVVLDRGRYELLTTDMILEGVHFTREMPPGAIGHKALACNLSDIAAMGGVARHALIGLGVPGGIEWSFMRKVYSGMARLARKFHVSLIGGDTVKSENIIINIFVTGEVAKKDLVLRSGAQAGDQIFVTGPLGGSLGSGRHLRFVPRLNESRYLVKNFRPTAMIDISDGLAADLGHVLKASGLGARIYERQIPMRRGLAVENVLYDGEDFELLFCLPTTRARKLKLDKKCRCFLIGEMTSSRDRLTMINGADKEIILPLKGYKHF